jgi:hypothetical protein
LGVTLQQYPAERAKGKTKMTSSWKRTSAAATLTAAICCALTIDGADAADKLRAGKAQAQLFIFAPLDIGVEEGILCQA